MLFLRGRQLEGSCLPSQQTWVTNKKPLSLLHHSDLLPRTIVGWGLIVPYEQGKNDCTQTLQVGIIALRNGERQPPDVAQCGNLCGPILPWRLLCIQDQRGQRAVKGRGLQGWLKGYSTVWAACSSRETITHKNMVQAWQIVPSNDFTY